MIEPGDNTEGKDGFKGAALSAGRNLFRRKMLYLIGLKNSANQKKPRLFYAS